MKIRARETKKFCTCEGPFGCEFHDAKIDDIKTLHGIPHETIMRAIKCADMVSRRLENANGDVYIIDCGIADDLTAALGQLAIEGSKVRA